MEKKIRNLTEIYSNPNYKNKFLAIEEKGGRVRVLFTENTAPKLYEKAKAKGMKKIHILRVGEKDNPYIFY